LKPKAPITDNVLSQLLTHISSNAFDHVTVRAVLLFAKFGVLRVSEYTWVNGVSPRISQVTFFPTFDSPEFIIFHFNKSKTNQFKQLERVILVCMCPNHCPVCTLQDMIKLRTQKPALGDDLFVFNDGRTATPPLINKLIKKLCIKSKLDPSMFASHRLRSGGVSDYIAHGVPDSIVQELARWKNINTILTYKQLSASDCARILFKHK